jgi:phosphoglycerate dehydrogenase-like enzyme
LEGIADVVYVKTPEEVAEVEGATYVVLRGGKMPAEVIKTLPESVRLIHRWGVGYDSVDIEAAAERSIHVAICTGGNAEPVAELTVLLMLAAYRCLPAQLQRAKEGRKDKEDIIQNSYLLQNKRVGLVGMGNIGSRVCRSLQAFGSEVVYYDVIRMPEEREQQLGVSFTDLDTLLATSDIVSIHVPLLESTKHMFNAQTFAKMKDGALLVNTARGGIVDLGALMEAVDSQKLMGAALDTVEGEPLPADHPVFANDRILITPHGGGNTCDNVENMVEIILNNILVMESGKLPERRYLVNQVK